jgi:hypothetical protein
MPFLQIITNISNENLKKVSNELNDCLASELSEAMHKPKGDYLIHLSGDQIVDVFVESDTFKSNEPLAIIRLVSICEPSDELNVKCSSIISKILENKLGLKSNNLLTFFISKNPADIGYMATTAQILKQA